MCCFKREMSALRRLRDPKAWCPSSILLELLSPQWEYKTKTQRIAQNQGIVRIAKR